MKKFVALTVLLAVLLCAGMALAGSPREAMIVSHPDGEIVLEGEIDEDAGVYACVVLDKGRYYLCAAMWRDWDWMMLCDTSDALLQTLPASVGFDTDGETLLWTYVDHQGYDLMYSARYTLGDDWDTVRLTRSKADAYPEGELLLSTVVHTRYSDGYVFREVTREDENGNVLTTTRDIPVPCQDRESLVLTSFVAENDPWLPIYEESDSWPGRERLQAAAAILFPGETFLGGSLTSCGWGMTGKCAAMRFLMRDADGAIRLRCVRDLNSAGTLPNYEITSSMPLPEGTIYGVENFTHSLWIPGTAASWVSVDWNGAGWGVTELGTQSGIICAGRNWVKGDETPAQAVYGDHPWADIQTIDWLSLPEGMDEAVGKMDLRQYAVVCNPNPADRPHLRERPDKSSRSLGKFYNGTPVYIFDRQGGWAYVKIGTGRINLTGWMMEKYLVTGMDATRVESSFPQLFVKDELKEFGMSDSWQPQKSKNIRVPSRDTPFTVVGVMEGSWYIVLLDDGDCGYVHIDTLTPGNG